MTPVTAYLDGKGTLHKTPEAAARADLEQRVIDAIMELAAEIPVDDWDNSAVVGAQGLADLLSGNTRLVVRIGALLTALEETAP